MNRKARRKVGKKGKVKTYTLTDRQIESMKDKLKEEVSNELIVQLMGLSVLALRDKFGFGATRLERFTDEFLKKLDDFNQGYFTMDDLYQVLEEETGLTFEDVESNWIV